MGTSYPSQSIFLLLLVHCHDIIILPEAVFLLSHGAIHLKGTDYSRATLENQTPQWKSSSLDSDLHWLNSHPSNCNHLDFLCCLGTGTFPLPSCFWPKWGRKWFFPCQENAWDNKPSLSWLKCSNFWNTPHIKKSVKGLTFGQLFPPPTCNFEMLYDRLFYLFIFNLWADYTSIWKHKTFWLRKPELFLL